jgi:hypothetical protein
LAGYAELKHSLVYFVLKVIEKNREDMIMTTRKIALFILIGILLFSLSSLADPKREFFKEYDKKELVSLKTVSGDCIIKTGNGDKITIEVTNEYSPRDSFEPIFRERGKTLRLREKLYGSNHGSSTWVLTVPEGTEIDFSSASGGLMVQDYNGELRGNTASGDYEIINCKGIFDLNSASGYYEIENCQGEFDVHSASGNIDASGIIITGESDFASASGNVRVTMGATPEHDLNVGSASGRAQLSYDGNKLVGFFELTSRYDSGRIDADFEFDDVERFRKNGQRYIMKTFIKETDDPLITVGTASGRASLRE